MMKKYLLTWSIFCLVNFSIVKAQILYDYGPIVDTSQTTSSFVLAETAWDKGIITYFFENGTNDITANNEQQAIRDGFQLWSEVVNLVFLEVCSANDADIVISWEFLAHGDIQDFDGNGGILAHAFSPPPHNFGDLAGDIHFDDSEVWEIDFPIGANEIDLVTVAAHEIGHSLGLLHTEVPNSLMNAMYDGPRRFLGQDDIEGIRALYGDFPTPIQGPRALTCTGQGTYNIPDLPAGFTVTWTAGSGINIDPNTGFATRTLTEGSSVVIATITGPCENMVLQQEVFLGIPQTEVVGISTHQGFIACESFTAINPAEGVVFQWTSNILPITADLNDCYNGIFNLISPYTTIGSKVYGAIQPYRHDIIISVRAVHFDLECNETEVGPWSGYRIQYDNPYDDGLIIYPNPGDVSISIGTNPYYQPIDPNIWEMMQDAWQNTTFSIQFYNGLGNLVSENQRVTLNQAIDISHLPVGEYVVHILEAGELVKQAPFLIQR